MTTAQLMDASKAERNNRRLLLEQGMRAVLLRVEQTSIPISQQDLEASVAADTKLPSEVVRQSIWRLLSSGVLRFTAEEGDIALV